jgi:hypothetical protein
MHDTGSSTVDILGVRMLYPTKRGGEQWFLGLTESQDIPRFGGKGSRFDPQASIMQNADGSWKMAASKVRMNVYTSSGYHPERITTYAQGELERKGYMQDPNDWKNVEITGFVKVNGIVDSEVDDSLSWYARGGKHTASRQCEGTSYKGDLFYSGKTRFAKEQWHNRGYSFTKKVVSTAPLLGRWIGFKFVVFNTTINNLDHNRNEDGGQSKGHESPAVVLQAWINEDADKENWIRAEEFIDAGGWGREGCRCNAPRPDQQISWGGPIVTFRWDGSNDVDFRDLSVREIDPSRDIHQ